MADAAWNPLVHYVLHCKEEGRTMAPAMALLTPEQEAMTAMGRDLDTVRGELAAARKVRQALAVLVRRRAGAEPPSEPIG